MNDAKKGAFPGISTIYHYQYEFTEADGFVGMRVCFHEGIGCGKFYTANDCDCMLLQHEGLNEVTKVKMNEWKAQKQETAKDTSARAVVESGVMMCQYCAKPFMRQQRFRAHEDGCVEQFASRGNKRKTAVLRPASDLAQDQVYLAASLSIGQDNVFRGQENKDLYFLKQIPFFPSPRDVPVVKEGCACKGVAEVEAEAPPPPPAYPSRSYS